MSRLSDRQDHDADVIIVGAGPTGLMLANLLGDLEVPTLLIEGEDILIDYPRAVNMDDESMRTFQAVGLAENVLGHVTQSQWLRFFSANGRCLASIEPTTTEFGWTRRNAFIQPQIDTVALDGLKRFSSVQMIFSTKVTEIRQDSDGVTASIEQGARQGTLRSRFLIACDGGKSSLRKKLGIEFGGFTDRSRWMVIDVAMDPLGTPASNLYCDPRRPYVSISLPHGMRRFEFMMFDHEDEAEMLQPQMIATLLERALPAGANPADVRITRARIYTHNARIADRWRVDRVLLAGDAAHIMPVWQGQGYNSGLRDSFNLAWKLALILRGVCEPDLLTSYQEERKTHAKAMIDISVTVGRIFSPTNVFLARFRDVALLALNLVPPIKRYVTELRFKPMPKFDDGVVVHDPALGKRSPIGRIFTQPMVERPDGTRMRLDDVIGNRFAVITWAADAAHWADDSAKTILKRLDAVFITVRPMEQLATTKDLDPETMLLGDANGILKIWFGRQDCATVVIRPDRVVAGACFPANLSTMVMRLSEKLCMTSGANRSDAGSDAFPHCEELLVGERRG